MPYLTSKDFSEWLAYYALEPFGKEEPYLGSGIIASTMANVFRDAKKQKEPFKASDFMPDFDPRPKKTTKWEKMLAMVEVMNQELGGKDMRQ